MQVIENIKVNRNVVSITSIDETDEKEFWLNQTPEKRFEAIEMMRQIAYGYDETSEGFQRVFEVAERQ